MRKLIAASVGAFGLVSLAFSAMPAWADAAHLEPPDPCFAGWLQCVASAAQDAFCCANAGAQACPVTFAAPQAEVEAKKISCRAEFRDDLNGCDTDYESCESKPAPASPAAPAPKATK